MRKVVIKKNTDGDTRVANRIPTISQFEIANKSHIKEVDAMLHCIAEEIGKRGYLHDNTKVRDPYKTMFYNDLCSTIKGEICFTDGEWSKIHYSKERHHINRNCPDDVNLIDIIEMICDCVCAGMARSGEVYPITIPEKILTRAVANTVQMCIDSVEVTTE